MIASNHVFSQPISTFELEQAAQGCWDTIVIGAGVAGAATAIHAARNGLRVLLVEAKSFPREKVCGGCLNRRAQDAIARLGLADQLRYAGSVDLSEIHIQVHRVGFSWPIPSLLSVRRSTLDSMLVSHAISQGACFLSNTTATLEPIESTQDASQFESRDPIAVRLRSTRSTNSKTLSNSLAMANTVVVACGLTRSALKPSSHWPSNIDPSSRIGVQSLVELDRLNAGAPELGRILQANGNRLHMIASRCGYVGICMTDGQRVDLAAAIDPATIKHDQPISKSVARILLDCGIQTGTFLDSCHWIATPLLTRQSASVAKPGIFLCGDALGYIEPFTGEGMSWAFDNAENLTPLLLRCTKTPSQRIETLQKWESYVKAHRKLRQRVCKWVAKQARHPLRSQWVLKACHWCPPFRNKILKEAIQ
ncbi:MAG: NAD(P)/FAD-dependent oxidoreductase [Pirellula sp.]